MSNTLLSYAVSANQSPIQVSPPEGDPSLATLIIVVSNSTHQLINCQSISFGFLQGTDAKDFFSDSTGIGTAAPTGWSLTQDESDPSLFTAKPDTPANGQLGHDSVTFVLSNIKVNQQPGTTQMTITEEASGNTGTLSYPLAKFPVQFTVGQIKAAPVTVNQGDSTTVSWDCSPGASYSLQYMDVPGHTQTITETKDGQPLPAVGSYTIDNLQVSPTIIYLIVSLTVPGLNQPLVFDTWFPVTVVVPNVTINSFTASATTVEYPGDTVTFTWDVTAATKVQLNGETVEGNSATVVVNQTGPFTLQAFGQGGPVTYPIQVTVASVKIKSFTATPATVYGNNNNAPVTLAWDVQSPDQLILNNNVVTGQSQAVQINETSSFTLEATGYNGPVYDEIGVNVAPVNLAASLSGNTLNFSFNANPGTYNAKVGIGMVGPDHGFFNPLWIQLSIPPTTTNNFGLVQVSQDLGPGVDLIEAFGKFAILYVTVTLAGFPSGEISVMASRTS